MAKEYTAPLPGTKEFQAAWKRTMRDYEFELWKPRCLLGDDGTYTHICVRMVRKDDPQEVRYINAKAFLTTIFDPELEAPPRAQHKARIYVKAMCEALGLDLAEDEPVNMRVPYVTISTLEECPSCYIGLMDRQVSNNGVLIACQQCPYTEVR